MNSIKYLSLTIFLICVNPLTFASDYEHYPLQVGEQKSIAFEKGIRYAPSSDSIRVKRIMTEGTEALLVKGVKSGHATLIVYKKSKPPLEISFNILGKQDPNEESSDRLRSFLNSLEDAKFTRTRGEGVVLHGEIRTMSEGRKIRAFEHALPGILQNRTTPSIPLFKSCLKNLNSYLKKQNADSLKIEFSVMEPSIEITGSVDSEIRRQKLLATLEAICPFMESKIEINSKDLELIRLKVVLLENYESNRKQLGFSSDLSRTSQMTLQSGKFFSSFGVLSHLNALEAQGKLKILSQPEIVLRTPGEAELFSGGEIPIETSTKFTSNVSWRNVGLEFKVKSLSVTQKRVKLDLSTVVSHLDPSLNSEHQPGMKLNRLKTQVEANFDEPLLLSGLYQIKKSTQSEGVPVLGRLPFFNLFFSKKSHDKNKTELLAILIPYKVIPKLSNSKIFKP